MWPRSSSRRIIYLRNVQNHLLLRNVSSRQHEREIMVTVVFGCVLAGAIALCRGCRRGVDRSRLRCMYTLVLRPADRFERF